MHSEVFYDLVYGSQTADGVTLNLEGREQIGVGETRKDLGCLLHGCAELLKERRSWNYFPLIEFDRPIASVVEAVERCDQPLADVAVQMQEQISDAIAGGIGTPPDLFIG